MALKVNKLRDYDHAKVVVDRCVGFKCVTIVVKLQRGNHTMAAMCADPNGDYILCYNTWGDDTKHPTMMVSRDMLNCGVFLREATGASWQSCDQPSDSSNGLKVLYFD